MQTQNEVAKATVDCFEVLGMTGHRKDWVQLGIGSMVYDIPWCHVKGNNPAAEAMQNPKNGGEGSERKEWAQWGPAANCQRAARGVRSHDEGATALPKSRLGSTKQFASRSGTCSFRIN